MRAIAARALDDEAALHELQRLLQLGIADRLRGHWP